MSTTRKIRVGLVGIGNWGRYGHMPVLQLLPYHRLPASKLEASVLDLAHLYNAVAEGGAKGHEAPTVC